MLTRDKLLVALDGCTDRLVSGSDLAAKLGITRASVWKQMKVLQKAGIPIVSDSRSGYRLPKEADFSLAELKFVSNLRGWLSPHYDLALPSTQIPAKEAAQSGAAEGGLWIAETQTAGKGRLDRRWESSFGGIWMSLLLRPNLSPSRIPALPLVAAWSLAKTLRLVAKVDARLKWPNDVGIGSGKKWRKVAGVLTEMSADMDRTHWVVLGVGINVFNKLPKELSKRATTVLQEVGKRVPRGYLLNVFLTEFQKAYATFQSHGFEPFRKRYWSLYRLAGEQIRVHTARGLITGRARGVDREGGLIVESRRQIHHLLEGEILS